MVDWYIGTMGFSYKQWIGPFYPDGLASRLHLTYYAERLNALEMDSTFYGMPAETTVRRWRSVTSDGFKMCPKMPGAITHEKRLVEAEELTAEFLDRMRLLGDKSGPILIQLPPNFTISEAGALINFLPQLPQDLRYAVEFRHRSWEKTETAVMLQAYQVCWSGVDYIHMAHNIVPTTDFLYLRFLGPRGRFPAKDREMVNRSEDLEKWRQKIQPHLDRVHSVYVFFNDDYSGFSPQTCNRFKDIIGLEPGEIRPMQQGRLF
ncbi:MAG: DUF72 domain-containing protein [Candidatus Promineifilaceae bacterium]|nr:DUF72 domain-containing protein [Candidatus Promineifilaceae bacterium]